MPKCMASHGLRSSSSQRCLPCRRTPRTRRPSSARRTRDGGSANTMGSAVTTTPTMRRPRATPSARTRAASTSGSSGTGPRLLQDLEQLYLEDQRGARPDLRRHAAVAVPDARRTHELALSPDLHELEPFGPAGDHLIQRKRRGLLPLDGAVEDGAVGELALVVHLDLVGGRRRGTGALLDRRDDETGRGLLGSRLALGLVEERLARLLLLGRGGAHPRLLERLDLRPVGLQIDLLVLAEGAVGEPGLDQLELARAQLERRQALADGEPDRVERLLLIGLQFGPGRVRDRGAGHEQGERPENGFAHDASFR